MAASWSRLSRCFTEATPSHVVWELFAFNRRCFSTWPQAGHYLSHRNALPLSNGSPTTGSNAQKPGAPSPTPFAVASARTPPNVPNIPAVTPASAPKASGAATEPVAQASPPPTATPVPVLPAQPVPPDASNVALASNAGGGSWKTFPPGKMPLGRLVGTGDLRDVAEHGLAGEGVYLK